jgi:hypothetical protein
MTQASSVVQRIESLEREVRRWRRGAVLLTLAAVGLATMAHASTGTRVVEAQRFVLKDSQGRVRAEWGGDNDHSIALRFKDDSGAPRLTLGLEDDAALLVLSEKGGRPRAGLVTLGHGVPGLTFYDALGRARAELGLARDGAASVSLIDARGGVSWKSP